MLCTRDRAIADKKEVSFQLKCSCPTAPLQVNTEGNALLTTAKVRAWPLMSNFHFLLYANSFCLHGRLMDD